MKKHLTKFWVLVALISLVWKSDGQNLVPNGSFEEYNTCPNFISELNHAVPWFQPSFGTTDFYHVCSDTLSGGPLPSVPQNFIGYQDPRTGSGYAGLFTSIFIGDTAYPYREYLEVKLINPLQAGTEYFVSFYVSLSDSVNFATDDIGAYFSNDTIQSNTECILSVSPQIINSPGNFITDRIGWTHISGEYLAQGGEEFLTIGNFNDDNHTDTLFVTGGSLVDPEVVYTSVYYYVDDICVATDSLSCFPLATVVESTENTNTFISSIPFTTHLQLHCTLTQPGALMVYDALGRKVKSYTLVASQKTFEFSLAELPAGVYLVAVNSGGRVWVEKMVKENR